MNFVFMWNCLVGICSQGYYFDYVVNKMRDENKVRKFMLTTCMLVDFLCEIIFFFQIDFKVH